MRHIIVMIWAALLSGAVAKEASFDLKQSANGQVTRYSYLWRGDQLRIAEASPEVDSSSASVASLIPMNLYDLKKSELTLLLPANQSYQVLPLSALQRKSTEGSEGIAARAIAEGGTALPPAAMMAGDSPEPAEWKETGETREFHGFTCRKWILPSRRDEEFVVWAAQSDDLPPFHFLVRGMPPRFGPPPDARETWPDQVRAKNWFPFLVVLQNNSEHGQVELIRWGIENFSTKPLDQGQIKMFSIPENYFFNQSAHR